MNLLLLHKNDRISEDRFRVDGRRAEHIRKVLHAMPGDLLRAGIFGGFIGIRRAPDGGFLRYEAALPREKAG